MKYLIEGIDASGWVTRFPVVYDTMDELLREIKPFLLPQGDDRHRYLIQGSIYEAFNIHPVH